MATQEDIIEGVSGINDSAGQQLVEVEAQLLDREGLPVAGVGRLDQVIGEEAAKEFFDEQDKRRAYLLGRALMRWSGPSGCGYSRRRLGR